MLKINLAKVATLKFWNAFSQHWKFNWYVCIRSIRCWPDISSFEWKREIVTSVTLAIGARAMCLSICHLHSLTRWRKYYQRISSWTEAAGQNAYLTDGRGELRHAFTRFSFEYSGVHSPGHVSQRTIRIRSAFSAECRVIWIRANYNR